MRLGSGGAAPPARMPRMAGRHLGRAREAPAAPTGVDGEQAASGDGNQRQVRRRHREPNPMTFEEPVGGVIERDLNVGDLAGPHGSGRLGAITLGRVENAVGDPQRFSGWQNIAEAHGEVGLWTVDGQTQP